MTATMAKCSEASSSAVADLVYSAEWNSYIPPPVCKEVEGVSATSLYCEHGIR